MPLPPSSPNRQLADDVITELCRSRLGVIASALTRAFGAAGTEIVEDAVQDALCRALERWPESGVPVDPGAWVYCVARNRVLDTLRRERLLADRVSGRLLDQVIASLYPAPREKGFATADSAADDPELRAAFMCCDPALRPEGQLALTLRIVAGFSALEIGRALMLTEGAVHQLLSRARRRLERVWRGTVSREHETAGVDVRERSLMQAFYLMFNEGYHSLSGDDLLRQDLCKEAMRLTELLVAERGRSNPATHALMALELLLASRFPARVDANGDAILLEHQDRQKWDQTMIALGFDHLARSARGDAISTYHLEAEIAAYHATASSYAETQWPGILAAYDSLSKVDPSPVVALNRLVALASAGRLAEAAQELTVLTGNAAMQQYVYFFVVAGNIETRLGLADRAAASYRRALALGVAGPSRRLIERRFRGAMAS